MTFRRIVLALDPSSSEATLATAVDLARAMEAELLGLFVEDTDLIQLAALPFAGEVGFPSAARRVLDVGVMERSLRAHARRMRDELDALLAGLPVKFTFEVVRGRVPAALARVVADRDLVAVSVSRGATRAAASLARAFAGVAAPLLLVAESHGAARTLAIVPPPRADAGLVADLVGVLAPNYGGCALFVAAGEDGAHWEQWQRDVRAKLADRVACRFRILTRTVRGDVERLLAAERTRLVVALASAADARDALLDALPWPLLVLPLPHESR